MSKEELKGRIISDAEAQAAKILEAANARAEEIISQANKAAERNRLGAEAEIAEKCRAIESGKAAEARLDCAKIALKERRRVIDAVYDEAYKKLCDLPKAEALKFAEMLLQAHAEVGEEIAFSPDYKWAQEVSKLPVVAEKKLKIALNVNGVTGGFKLLGKSVDKDLSYKALLSEDKESYQGELATQIFKL